MPSPSSAGVAEPPDGDILLVSVDTLRADSLGAYGDAVPCSPFLDRLSRRGTVFADCHSTSSWTAPAVASLVTGLRPTSHGITQGIEKDRQIIGQQILPPSVELLPQLLHARGYRTYGVTANAHLDPALGFGRGFDSYECLGFAHVKAVENGVAKLRTELGRAGAWFLWLHYFDPHAPYLAREPWVSAFHDGPRFEALSKLHLLPAALDDRELTYVRALYRSEIAFVDHSIRRLFTANPRFAEASFVITSDHGEEFFEHGKSGHGLTLSGETVRVPLLLGHPGLTPGVGAGVTSLVDVMPTVAGWAGAPVASDQVPLDASPRGDRQVISELSRETELRAGITEEWKVIIAPGVEGGWLYDLAGDPGEQHSLTTRRPRIYGESRERLLATLELDRASAKRPATLDTTEERRQELKALGYLD